MRKEAQVPLEHVSFVCLWPVGLLSIRACISQLNIQPRTNLKQTHAHAKGKSYKQKKVEPEKQEDIQMKSLKQDFVWKAEI